MAYLSKTVSRERRLWRPSDGLDAPSMHARRWDSRTFSLKDFSAWRAETTCISTSEQSVSASTIFSRPSIWPLIFRRRTTSARFSSPGRVGFAFMAKYLTRLTGYATPKLGFDQYGG